jgi:hypothetical protein
MSRARFALLVLVFIAACFVSAAAASEVQADKAFEPLDVLQLRVEAKNLVLRTKLAPTAEDEVRMLKLPALHGTAELTNTGGRGERRSGRAAPGFFRLQLSNDRVPSERVGWQVSWLDGTLDIQRSAYFTGQLNYTRLVRLFASTAAAADPRAGRGGERRSTGNAVKLIVTEVGNTGRTPLRVYVGSKDFTTLLHEHPQEVEEFLRPMLRELGQEAVFAPEPLVAWQVFADQWSLPEKLSADVSALLPSLDADDAAVRERASKQLADLGRDVAVALMQLDRTKLSAEQNTRIDAVLAAHTRLSPAEATQRRSDVSFLLDCLYCDDEHFRAAALERLRAVCSRPIDFNPQLPGGGPREAAVAALRTSLQK